MMIVERSKPKKNKAAASTCNTVSRTFLINIGISQPKIRIQVPKLLAKTMQRSRQDHPTKPTLPKKMISILCSVFRSKKSKAEPLSKANKLEESRKAISQQGSSRRLVRVASGRPRVRIARPVRKKVDREREKEEAENNVLWKKRILMGGKCKPVDFSVSAELGYYPTAAHTDTCWGYS